MPDQIRQNLFSWRGFFKSITIEPVLCLSTLAWALQSQTMITLSLHKICHVTLHYSSTVCRDLNNKTIEKEVEEIENDLSVYRSYIEFIPSLILSFVLGAWSDNHGRKMPMLFAKFGYLVAAFVLLVISLFDEWPPETLFAFSAAIGLTGGNRVFETAAISYIADVSSPEWRTSRFGFFTATKFISFPIGTAISGYTQAHWGFWLIFASAAAVRLISFIYLTWRIQVIIPVSNISNEQTPQQIAFKHRLRNIFSLKDLKAYFRVLFKRRDGHYRLWILLIVAANWFQTVPSVGEVQIAQLFYRYKFSWGQDIYSYYSAVGTLLACIGTLICLPVFANKLKLSDPTIELIGNVATIVNPILVAFSTQTWMLWAALSLTTFYAFVFPAMKSFSTKIIDPDEYGKLFALKDGSEVFISFFAGVMYTRLYNKTLDSFPGAAYLLSAAFCSISAVFFCIILVDFKRLSAYNCTVLLQSEEDSNSSYGCSYRTFPSQSHNDTSTVPNL